MRSFIDLHCHMFNFVDIPVYETLKGEVTMNTTVKLLAAISASGALLSGLVKQKIQGYKDFIQFFERPQELNMQSIAHEIATAVDANQLILTPLVMDFDCVHHNCAKDCKPCSNRNCTLYENSNTSVSRDPTANEQLFRLQAAMKKLNTQKLPNNKKIKFFPFLGFDLRKLTPKNSRAMADLKELWHKVGVKKNERANGFENIENGKVLGIKLYPPIGFNPNPSEKKALAVYKIFYEWCIEEHIPLTVHCQSGSYSSGRKQKDVNRDTHARNWYTLYNNWGKKELTSNYKIKDLRINFAHFGGEQGLEDMLDPFRWDGIDEESWTYKLIMLMRRYPNTFADVSAFDWADRNSVKNFAKLLDLDTKGKLGGGEYSIKDKLLWGSDIPMVLDASSYRKNGAKNGDRGYGYLLDNFKSAIDKSRTLDVEGKNELKRNMMETTPHQFLL